MNRLPVLGQAKYFLFFFYQDMPTVVMRLNPARIYGVAVFMSVMSGAYPEGDYSSLCISARRTRYT